ncbi:MAG: TIGR03960 family B12-binding radical SAM protein [Clostridium sp.]|nr:TIGR03960 family B12-binding radical SAM protein [Clostridium sp.]MCM1398744.1 TIGR03960 family B12-binding radical SAM protein [Clostridium sp.]MCM1458624.1 TIGR03960 family B12-binding radical SAM protein [Bacteroides sp.]
MSLALKERILMNIEKPARYIGNEVNMVKKNPCDVDVRIAMCFPDVYEIGMSYLGIQIIYDMFNRRMDTYCERVYSPWPDLDKVMREEKIPLFSLETQSPISEFDMLGITIQYEMCYTNILQVIDLAGIPIFAGDRKKGDPLVIGGGPCTVNPEPIADFFDMFYIGEAETSYDELIDLIKVYKKSDMTREAFLREASHISGIYVPSLYEVAYHADGTIKSVLPLYDDVPAKVKRQVVTDFKAVTYPLTPVVPYLQATQDRVCLEIMRGCIRGCRFCQAGMIYRPTRQKNVELLKGYARQMLDGTGYEEISLSSLSSSDYQYLDELLNYLISLKETDHVNVSLPSLRIDAFSLDVMSKVQDIKKSSLTFAAEAGSQRLRDVINKGITEEDILNGSRQAFLGGWDKVKLYFMMGLPTEQDADLLGIAELAEKISEEYFDAVPKEKRNGRVMVNASSSFFVPKPFTPFQWAPMINGEEYKRRAYFVKDAFLSQKNKKSLKFTYHDAGISVLEGVLARGDRRLCKSIYDTYKKGAIFDAWTEFFDMDRYITSFEENGIDMDFYTARTRRDDEVFPWDHIDAGVSKAFLLKEWKRAREGVVTPNCRMKCQGCGSAVYGGGVCFEA